MKILPWANRYFNRGIEPHPRLCSVVFVICLFITAVVEAQEGAAVAERFQQLTRSSPWKLERTVRLGFNTHHPQGMAVVGDRIYLSSVHAINRSKGDGEGFLFEVSMDGALLRTLPLGEGAVYHPGGLDAYDGAVWVSVAEYRPDSSSIVYRVDTKSMKAQEIFRFEDHLGGIVWDARGQRLIANSWGSRHFYTWDTVGNAPTISVEKPKAPVMRANRSHFVDYQDAQWLPGTSMMLCGGLASVRGPEKSSLPLGGMALIDTRDTSIVHEVPVPLYTESGKSMNQNPFYCQSTETGLRFYFIPEDNRSTLYIYHVRTRRAKKNAARLTERREVISDDF